MPFRAIRFSCTEATRTYKERNRLNDAEKAIAKLDKTHKFLRLDILKALRGKECSHGTNSRLAYLKALQQLEIECPFGRAA
jgi:hypothetical protein